MYNNILLCTDGSPAAEVAGDYAIWFARKLHARLSVLYVTDIRLLEGPLLADLSGALGAQPYPGLLPQFQELQREKAATVLAAVRQRCETQQVACEVTHETGNLVAVMLAGERNTDMVVLGQRGEHAAWMGEMLGSSVERLVRASNKPCLVTPPTFRPIRHLLLAYDGSSESRKALTAGIDLALTLAANATLLTVCDSDHEETAAQHLQDARQQAHDRGLPAHAQLTHGEAETEILKFADRVSADLIVMGAYGHTRIRELVLGSTTSHVMRKATVPVLLSRG